MVYSGRHNNVGNQICPIGRLGLQLGRDVSIVVASVAIAICSHAAQVCSAAPPGGVPIPILNAGFESNPVAPGCFAGFLPTAWSTYDPNGILDGASDAVGCVHADGSPFYPVGGAPEGVNIALIFLNGDTGGGPVGLFQNLPAVLEANETYTLQGQIGNILSAVGPPPCDVFGFFNLNGFPGYRLQLLAGGVVVLEENNSLSGTIPEGEFRFTRVSTTIQPGHPQIGQPLAVRLINLNIAGPPEAPGVEVNFDDIRLYRGCVDAGDLDDNDDVNAADLVLFIDVLLGVDSNATHVERSDANCSGAADGRDIAEFVEIMLG